MAQDNHGRLKLWIFEMENKAFTGDLKDYLVVTNDAEEKEGGLPLLPKLRVLLLQLLDLFVHIYHIEGKLLDLLQKFGIHFAQ